MYLSSFHSTDEKQVVLWLVDPGASLQASLKSAWIACSEQTPWASQTQLHFTARLSVSNSVWRSWTCKPSLEFPPSPSEMVSFFSGQTGDTCTGAAGCHVKEEGKHSFSAIMPGKCSSWWGWELLLRISSFFFLLQRDLVSLSANGFFIARIPYKLWVVMPSSLTFSITTTTSKSLSASQLQEEHLRVVPTPSPFAASTNIL